MADSNSGSEAPYIGSDEKTPNAGQSHDSALEQAATEPKQGTGRRLEDWNQKKTENGTDLFLAPVFRALIEWIHLELAVG